MSNGWAVLAAVALLAAYAAACAIYPFTAHGRCKGTGKLRSPTGRAWRRCPGCRGTGSKIRIGRRLFNVTTSRRQS